MTTHSADRRSSQVSFPRTPAVALLLTAALVYAASGCTGLYLVFGPNGIFPPTASGPAGGGTNPGGNPSLNPNTGGVSNPSNTVPTTSAPNPVSPPNFRISLLDDLFEATAGPNMIISTDFNADGLPDFASIASESQVVQVFIRDAANTRYDQLPIAGGLPLTRMVRIAAADFDGDGRVDLAVAVNNTGIAPTSPASKVAQIVLIFAPPDPRDQLSWLTVPLTNALRQCDDKSITDMVVADFDSANGPDIAFLSNEPPPAGSSIQRRYVFMFLNPGPGSARTPGAWGIPRPGVFGTLPPFVEIDAPDATQLAAADVDSDGNTDLVASFSPAESYNIRWLQNPGPASIDPNPAVALPRWQRRFVGQQDKGGNVLAVADIDGDGSPDVGAATNTPTPLIQWFRNPGAAVVTAQAFPWNVYNIGATENTPINQLAFADINSDGRLDTWYGANGVIAGFFPRAGANLFDWWTPFTIASTNPVAVIGFPAFLDIDGNGRTDFVVPLDRTGLTQDGFAIFSR